MLSAVFDRGMG